MSGDERFDYGMAVKRHYEQGAPPGWEDHYISAYVTTDQLVREWASLTYVLNNLTRGLGLPDAYPFVLCAPVVEKLRFIANTMAR